MARHRSRTAIMGRCNEVNEFWQCSLLQPVQDAQYDRSGCTGGRAGPRLFGKKCRFLSFKRPSRRRCWPWALSQSWAKFQMILTDSPREIRRCCYRNVKANAGESKRQLNRRLGLKAARRAPRWSPRAPASMRWRTPSHPSPKPQRPAPPPGCPLRRLRNSSCSTGRWRASGPREGVSDFV